MDGFFLLARREERGLAIPNKRFATTPGGKRRDLVGMFISGSHLNFQNYAIKSQVQFTQF